MTKIQRGELSRPRPAELSAADLECLEIGRNVKLAGLRLAMNVLREQMELLQGHAHPPVVNGAIKPAMLRTLVKAGIALPALPAPVKARRGRPPGKPRAKAAQSYWAKMTPQERSAEMKRRQAVTAGTTPARDSRTKQAKPVIKLARANHPRYADHPDHEAWVARMRKANRKSWAGMTPEARQARIDATNAGRGIKPKS